MKKWTAPLMALGIFLLNVLLNAPLFMSGELPFRESIEGGYVGMARFFSEHPNPWGWNPLPYCGLPAQFMYVPGVPYVSALVMHWLPHVPPDQVFRTIVSLMTCLGPVTLFLFALYFTKSPVGAFVTAIAYSLVSASYALFPAVEKDRGIAQLSWHVKVLAKYGEGPHNSGLTLLPLALLALWRAVKGRGYPLILAAAIPLALIPLTNWVAALGLAISCALLLIAAWGEPEVQLRRALIAAGLAYLLACFWLTPSFIGNIVSNWPVDSYGYKVHNQQTWSLLGLAAGVVLIRLLFRFLRGSFYFCFVTLSAFVFGWIATIYYVFNTDTVPESHRYAIEFELFLALALLEVFRRTLRSSDSTIRMCAKGTLGVMLIVGAPQLWNYLTQGWDAWAPAPPESTVEYRIAQWIAQHPPSGRVFATGGLRYRLDSWFDLPQIGGGFETGLSNRVPVDVAYHIRVGNGPWRGHEAEETMLELKALGAEYVVIHGPKSREFYRDFRQPERIANHLQPVFHIEDDTVYALPFHSLAHVMQREELPDADVVVHPQALARYVAAIEDPSRPYLTAQWAGPDKLEIAGPIPQNQVVAVQVSNDDGWEATEAGQPVEITEDRLGFMVLHPTPAAAAHIELQYHGTLEQKAMALLSLLAWIGALLALFRKTNFRLVASRVGKAATTALLLVAVPASGADYHLNATPQTIVWGYYSAAAKPVLHVRSGDTVTFETLITSSPERLTAAGVKADQIEPELRTIYEQVKDKGPGGHILTGPVYIEDAKPGDVLEVRILKIQPKIPYAYNGFSPGRGFLPEDFPTARTKIIPFDLKRNVALFAPQIEIPMRPFFGSMGVAPPSQRGTHQQRASRHSCGQSG